MTNITIDTRELDALLTRFAGARPVVEREAIRGLDRSAIRVQNSARGNLHSSGAIDTGQLLNSIGVEPRGTFARAIGTNKSYGETVEFGRRAGAPMPPAGSLLGWLQRHDIPADMEYVIRRRIADRGIPARPYLMPALEDNEPAIQEEFALAAQRAMAELVR